MGNSKKQHTLDQLWNVIESRKGADPKSSYTAKMLARGTSKAAQKLGEEAVETAVAAVSEPRENLISESADVLYHLLVLWACADVKPQEVWGELEGRFGISGLEEKASRKQDG